MTNSYRCQCGGRCPATAPAPRLASQLARARRGFSRVTGRNLVGFCCPLCLRLLPDSCASLAHAPARALGGRPVAFLCRACNGYLSRSFEAAAISSLAAIGAGSNRQELTVRFGPKGGPQLFHRALLETDGVGNQRLTLLPLGKIPGALGEDMRKNRPSGFTMEFTFATNTAIRLAFMSWAFVGAFGRFGYSYALGRSSRLPRAALLDQTATMDDHYLITYGPVVVPFPRPEVSLMLVQLEPEQPPLGLVALGVAFRPFAAVCLPIADDPTGRRVIRLGAITDDTGIFDRPVVAVPFEAAFPESRAASQLGGACLYVLGESNGTATLVGTSPAEAAATLAGARAPNEVTAARSRRRRASRGESVEDEIDLPTGLSSSTWVEAALDDVLSRMQRDGTSDPQAVERLRHVARADGPAAMMSAVASELDGVLASHVTDAYRLFSLAQPVDDIPWSVAEDRMRRLGRALRLDLRVAGYSSHAHDDRPIVVAHSCRLVVGDTDRVVGPYYTVRTLLLAIEGVLRQLARRS